MISAAMRASRPVKAANNQSKRQITGALERLFYAWSLRLVGNDAPRHRKSGLKRVLRRPRPEKNLRSGQKPDALALTDWLPGCTVMPKATASSLSTTERFSALLPNWRLRDLFSVVSMWTIWPASRLTRMRTAGVSAFMSLSPITAWRAQWLLPSR
jgi:hypothetical protein